VFGVCRGAFAEYVCTVEKSLVLKPANVTWEQAAAVPIAACTSLQGLRKGQIHPGHKVLINGAAGGVGTFAVQIAKSLGAEVTGVCSTKSDRRRVLGSRGTLVIVGGVPKGNWLGPLVPLLTALVMSPFVSQTLAPLLATGRKEDLIIMQGLLEARTVVPVIDRTYPLSKVPEAIRYLEEGHAREKVVVMVPGVAL
jgi:NADPH:quinone reductase-like Zn-dependent oxidoreductase